MARPSPPPVATGAADQAPLAPDVEEVWQLPGRAELIVRGRLEAADRDHRIHCEERARVWLRDAGQA